MAQFTQDNLTALLGKYDLDYNVAMTECINPFSMEKDEKNFCVYREDTKQIFKYGMSSSFTPIQNQDAFACIVDLAKVQDIEVVKMAHQKGGAGVFAQINLGGDIQVGNHGDKVSRYIAFVNSHDGSRAMNIVLTPYRFFCANQINKAIRFADKENENGRQKLIAIRHTTSAKLRLEELVETLHIIDGQFETSAEHYNKLASLKINEEYVKEVVNKLFPLNAELGSRSKTIWTNTVNAVKQRYYDADGGRGQVNTAWNLYNAVQGTIQHDSKNTASKEWSTLFGSIAEKSEKALAIVTETCSSTHIPQSVMSEIDALMA